MQRCFTTHLFSSVFLFFRSFQCLGRGIAVVFILRNFVKLFYVFFMFSGFFFFFFFFYFIRCLFGSVPWFVHDFGPKFALAQSSVMDDIEEWLCTDVVRCFLFVCFLIPTFCFFFDAA